MVPKWLTVALLVAAVALVLPPILLIFSDVATLAVEDPQRLNSLLSKPYYLYRPLVNSVFVCSLTALLATLVGLMFAWLLARYNIPRRELLLSLLTGPYVIPSFLIATGWIMLWTNRGLYEQFTGMRSPLNPYGPLNLVFVLALHNYPLAMLSIYPALLNLDASLEEAARIHGVSPRRIATGIVLPLVLPSVLSGFILTFAYSISEFGAPAVLGLPVGYTTLVTQIYSLMTVSPVDYAAAEVLSVVLSAISLLALYLNFFVLSRKRYAVVTGKAARVEERKPSYKAFAAIATSLVLVYMPILAVIVGSLVRTWGEPITLSNLGVDHYLKILAMERSRRALVATLLLSLGAASIASIVGLLVAYVAVRSPSLLSRIIDYIVFLPFSIPGLVIGVGLLVAAGKLYGPLYGTVGILLVAFVIRFLPYATRTLAPALLQIDESLEEASRIHGVSFGKTLARVVLPLSAGALLSSWIFVFNSSMKELSASAILSTQVETAIVVAFLLFTDGYFSDGAALSIIIVLVTLLLTAVASKLAKGGALARRQGA
ncbi:ABC transporter permease [Thermofilum pendens]|nr:iron ABC transporter permease [Thermofilum pendens]